MQNLNALRAEHQVILSPSSLVSLLLGLSSIAVMLLQSVASDVIVSGLLITLVAGSVVLLISLDILLRRAYGEQPPVSIAISALLVHVLTVEFIALLDGLTYTAILYLTLPFPAFFWLGRLAGYIVAFGTLSWIVTKFFIFKPNWFNDPVTLNSFVLLVISLVLVTLMAEIVERERAGRWHTERLLHDLNRSHEQLALYAEQVAELATIAERNRLARDIHDSLGHYLTVIGIQLEKATVVYEDEPDEALKSVQHARQATTQTLHEVRKSVGTLREQPTEFVLQDAVRRLIGHWRDAPFSIDVSFKGGEDHVAETVRMTLYRAVQEGLTNIQKHADATHVSIVFCFFDNDVQLTISDNGSGIKQASGAGYGLSSLRERLTPLTGTLSVYSEMNQGTRLVIAIPLIGNNK